MEFFRESMLELITQTSTNLPPDVRAAMGLALEKETPNTQSSQALNIIAENIDMATEDEGPICQDTGMPTFEIKTPIGANQIVMKREIEQAVVEATRRGKLRPNSVDSLTGTNTGTNLGPGTPIIHFEQWERPEVEVRLILKGGGCENKNIQYSLPATLDHLGRADRTLDGVKKAILHAVWQAQGQGAARAQSASASAATAPRATTMRSCNCSARSTTRIPIQRLRPSKPKSWRRRTGWAWARWASAGRRR